MPNIVLLAVPDRPNRRGLDPLVGQMSSDVGSVLALCEVASPEQAEPRELRTTPRRAAADG